MLIRIKDGLLISFFNVLFEKLTKFYCVFLRNMVRYNILFYDKFTNALGETGIILLDMQNQTEGISSVQVIFHLKGWIQHVIHWF